MLKLSSKLQMSLFHVVVWQRTSRNYSKVRTARAARLFVLIRPIKFLIYDVIVAVSVVDAKVPYYLRAKTNEK